METWRRRVVFGAPMNVGWSQEKEARNRAKHGVGFEEALTALDDPAAISAPHEEGGEERDLLIGRSDAGRLLLVVLSALLAGDDDGSGGDRFPPRHQRPACDPRRGGATPA